MTAAEEQEQIFFTEGYCYALALELHARTGWPLWTCFDADDRQSTHALVRMPDGRYLDVNGPQTRTKLAEVWPNVWMRRITAAYLADWEGDAWGNLGPLCPLKVAAAADRLLAAL